MLFIYLHIRDAAVGTFIHCLPNEHQRTREYNTLNNICLQWISITGTLISDAGLTDDLTKQYSDAAIQTHIRAGPICFRDASKT